MLNCWADTQVTFKDALSEEGKLLLKKVIRMSRFSKIGVATRKVMDDEEFFNPEYIDYLRDIGLEPVMTLLFITQPGCRQIPHSDKPAAALNWCTSDHPDHLMKWYSVNEDAAEGVPGTLRGLNFVEYDINDLCQIDEKYIDGDLMTLVNTSIPHQVELTSQRVCVSIRVNINGVRADFDDILKKLSENNLL